MKVALLVPEATRVMQARIVGALREHCGSQAGWQIIDVSAGRGGPGQVGVQPLSRKRLFDAGNEPTVADVCEQ